MSSSRSSERTKRYSSFKNNKKDILDLNYDSDFSVSKTNVRKKSPAKVQRSRSRGSLSSRSYSRSPSASTRTGSRKKKETNKLSNTYTKSQINNNNHQYSSRSRTRSPSSVSRSRSVTPEKKTKNNYNSANSSIKNKSNGKEDSKTSIRSNAFRRPNQYNRNTYGRVQPNRKPPVKNTNPAPVGNLNQTARQVMSAQRFKNNELQNRIVEILAELNELKDENRTLKRVHIREEKALNKHESHDIDISKMMKTHAEELNVVKELHKKSKMENKRINNLLLDREEDLRGLKKKNDEFKKIINDKKLMDSYELSKKLENTDIELEEYKGKYEQNMRKLEMIEKNHKHEMGVEIAHHRDVKKRMIILTDENNELKVRLEEKERALDIANIYANRADNKQGNWKGSTSSLTGTPIQPDTPRSHNDKRKHAAQQKRKELRIQKPLKENESNTVRKRADDSPISINKYNTITLKEHQNIEDDEDYENEIEMANKKHEIDIKIKQQETELKQKDVAERAKRENSVKKRLEEEAVQQKMYLEKLQKDEENKEQRRLETKLEEERQKMEQIESGERERREKELKLQEEERRKRYVSPQLSLSVEKEKSLVDKTKKDDLLAKLALMDTSKKSITPPANNDLNFSTYNKYSSPNYNNSNKTMYDNSGLPPKHQSPKFTFDDNTEKLHHGKPISQKDSSKNELMNKLFSDDGVLSSKPPKSNNNDILNSQERRTSIDSLNKKTQNETSSKITLLPWEVQEVNYSTHNNSNSQSRSKMSQNSNNNTFSAGSSKKNDHTDFFSKLNGGGNTDIKSNSPQNDFLNQNNVFSRPKVDNKPINLFAKSKNSSFVEDIEELSL